MSKSGPLTGQRSVPGLSIANTLNPSQKQAWHSIAEPKEYSQTDWMFDLSRDPQNWSGDPALKNDNYFYLNEPWYNSLKDNMFKKLTGNEPIFGHMNYARNRLDQNQTNKAVNDLYYETQLDWNKNPEVMTTNPVSKYPQVPDILNYQGSTINRM